MEGQGKPRPSGHAETPHFILRMHVTASLYPDPVSALLQSHRLRITIWKCPGGAHFITTPERGLAEDDILDKCLTLQGGEGPGGNGTRRIYLPSRYRRNVKHKSYLCCGTKRPMAAVMAADSSMPNGAIVSMHSMCGHICILSDRNGFHKWRMLAIQLVHCISDSTVAAYFRPNFTGSPDNPGEVARPKNDARHRDGLHACRRDMSE